MRHGTCLAQLRPSTMTNAEALLQEKAREAIRRGALPRTRPDRRFGTPGSGETCAVCGVAVGRNVMEFEIEFNRHGVTPGLDRYHFHIRCYTAWEIARRQFAQE
jgi:hypothetical protein